MDASLFKVLHLLCGALQQRDCNARLVVSPKKTRGIRLYSVGRCALPKHLAVQ